MDNVLRSTILVKVSADQQKEAASMIMMEFVNVSLLLLKEEVNASFLDVKTMIGRLVWTVLNHSAIINNTKNALLVTVKSIIGEVAENVIKDGF